MDKRVGDEEVMTETRTEEFSELFYLRGKKESSNKQKEAHSSKQKSKGSSKKGSEALNTIKSSKREVANVRKDSLNSKCYEGIVG